MSKQLEEKIPVRINLKTTISNAGEHEVFELTVFGRYFEREGRFYLQYEEVMEAGVIQSLVMGTEEEILIERNGALNMSMVFQVNKRIHGKYETPYGVMELMTHTKRLVYDKESKLIDLLYELHMQGSHVGTYHLELTFKEENK